VAIVDRDKVVYRDTEEALTAARHYAWARRDAAGGRADNTADETFARLVGRMWRDFQANHIGFCETVPHAFANWRAHGGMFPLDECQRCGASTRRGYVTPRPRIVPRAKFVPLGDQYAAQEFPTGQHPPGQHDAGQPSEPQVCQRCAEQGFRVEQLVDRASTRP
jgi:hypothetical protein